MTEAPEKAEPQEKSYAIPWHAGAGDLYGLPHCDWQIRHRITVPAGTETMASVAETVVAEGKPRRQFSEDEILRAAITVILVALVTIMALAAAAILSMG
ncbi:hypothetical protein [Mycobacterium palustre]|uniref:hypothetical protein n=1 Tax=Mycobacterium palustre TaxID=153971 RepID=UPI0011539B21|nr:hypothetical protein [Mycobacterium palustre]MCV7100941.1 hypothetical protein [Mycobacterium palustre]